MHRDTKTDKHAVDWDMGVNGGVLVTAFSSYFVNLRLKVAGGLTY